MEGTNGKTIYHKDQLKIFTSIRYAVVVQKEEGANAGRYTLEGGSCKEYREYWDWVEKRNDVRFENTQKHAKNYDSKNMMHTFRLLQMAIEIGRDKEINVKRLDREFLLGIKSGKYEYEDLLQMAQKKQKEMDAAFEQSELRDQPDLEYINSLAYSIRKSLYQAK